MQVQQSSQRQNIIQQQILTPNYPYSIDLQFENPYDDLHPIMNSSSQLRYNSRYRSNISKKSNISNSSRGQLIKIERIQKNELKQCNNIKKNSHIHNINKNINQIAQQISQIELKKRQCRICLQDQSQGRLIRPCHCTGSMQYTHEYCLCEWIKRKSDLKCKNKVKCQVCNHQFQYKISRKLYLSFEQLMGNYEKYKSTYRCFIIMLIVSVLVWIGLIIVTVMGLVGNEKTWINQNIFATDTSEIILICVIVVYFVVIVLVVLLFIAEYGIKSENVVQNILNFTKKKKKLAPKLQRIAT